MLRFAISRGHEYTVAALRRHPGGPRLRVVRYDRLLAARRLRPWPTVFADLDRLGPWELELAAALHRQLAAVGVPVWNDPARVKLRFALLRALHEAGLNDFNAYRADEGIRPARFPVFLRRASGHGEPLSDLLPDWDACRRALDEVLARGVPESALLWIEYAAEPAAPGLFRKLAVARLGQRYVPCPGVHDEGWLVKYGKPGIATPEIYGEELAAARANRFVEALAPAFELAQIEYGRADFGLVGGRVQVYEINTNPFWGAPKAHPDPARVQSVDLCWRRAIDAFRGLEGPASGPPVRVRDRRLKPYRGWRGARRIGRQVP